MRKSLTNGSSAYLIRPPYGYHFRLKIPQDIKARLDNKRELRYSLRTGSLAEAKEKARLLAGQIQRLFRQLRQKGSYMATNLSDDEIQKMVKGYPINPYFDDRTPGLTNWKWLKENAPEHWEHIKKEMFAKVKVKIGQCCFTCKHRTGKERSNFIKCTFQSQAIWDKAHCN